MIPTSTANTPELNGPGLADPLVGPLAGLLATDSSSFLPTSAAANIERKQKEIRYQALKQSIHIEIVASLDLAAAEGLTPEQIQSQIRPFVKDYLERSDHRKLSEETKKRLEEELYDEMFGVGPLESLLKDHTVSDILVNNPYDIFIERSGQLEPSDVVFADQQHLLRVIQRIASFVGRRVDEVSPMVDARLPDGSRVNAVIPPLALDGPKLSIRRFGKNRIHLADLIRNGSISEEIATFLCAAVRARCSILISGGTGSGKTTLLNALSSQIPEDERIVTIEDSAELMLQHRHVARLETRPPNSEGSGEYTQRDLLKNTLRMRPDRIIVGEVRGAEVLDMLQAMNTGHEGSLTTVHANDSRDALLRLEMMIALSGIELPLKVVRSYIASGIHLVVHVARLNGGVRRLTKVSEILRAEDGYKINDIFAYQRSGVDDSGKTTGHFEAFSYVPECCTRIKEMGIEIDSEIFAATNSLSQGAQ